MFNRRDDLPPPPPAPPIPELISLGKRTQELAPMPGERMTGRKARLVTAEFYCEKRHRSRMWIRWEGDTLPQPYGASHVGGGDEIIKVEGWIAKTGFEHRWAPAPDDPPPRVATVD